MRGDNPKVELAPGHVIDFAHVEEAWEAPAAEGKGVCYRDGLAGTGWCGGAVHFVPDPAAQKIRDALGARLLPTQEATP